MAQEFKTIASDPLDLKPKEGASEQGGPPYPFLSPKMQQYPVEWHLFTPSLVILSKSIAARSRGAQRGPFTCQAVICSHVQLNHLGTKLSCPSCPTHSLTLMHSNDMASGCIPLGLQTQGKSVLCLGVITQIGSLRLRYHSLQEKLLC